MYILFVLNNCVRLIDILKRLEFKGENECGERLRFIESKEMRASTTRLNRGRDRGEDLNNLLCEGISYEERPKNCENSSGIALQIPLQSSREGRKNSANMCTFFGVDESHDFGKLFDLSCRRSNSNYSTRSPEAPKLMDRF
jgi:hypothetical protein